MNLHGITWQVLRDGLWFGYCTLSGADIRTVPFPQRNKKLFTFYIPRYCRQSKPTDLVGHDTSVSIALRAGRSGDRIPVGARFSAPVQTGPGTHPASYTMGTGSLSGGKAAGAWR